MVFVGGLSAQTYSGKLGYGFSPAGFPNDFSQYPAFFTEVANTCNGGVVMGNGNWRDSLSASGQLPALHKFISSMQPAPYGYVDMLVFGWASYPLLYLDAPGNATNNWTNGATKNYFLQTLQRAADSLKPAYLFIGNEINFYWEQDSADFLNWATFYSQAYDTIKKYSPATKVGTVYNFEHLSGSGAMVGWNAAYWGALTAMDTAKMDIIGFTVYPFLGNPTAASVPLTYLDPLFTRIGSKPVVITETGWPADTVATGTAWACNPAEQVTYVNKLFSILNGKNAEVVNWLFLNYLMSNDPGVAAFKSVAMRDSLGNDRPALPVWLSMCSTTDVANITGADARLVAFPNPVSSQLQIELSGFGPETQFELYDMLGNSIAKKSLSQANTSIDMSGLHEGLYLMIVRDALGHKVVRKIVRA